MVLQATHNVHHLVVNSVDCDPDIQVRGTPALQNAQDLAQYSLSHWGAALHHHSPFVAQYVACLLSCH